MCGSSPPKNDAAEEARKQEEERQARIAQGQVSIDKAFEGFGDKFIRGFQDDYVNAQLPELDKQFGDAREQVLFGLARNGLLESSAGADKLADLQGQYATAGQAINSDAEAAARQLRSNIAERKSNLTSQNVATANPTAAASAAAASAQNFQAPPQPSPLVDVFTSLINSGATAAGTGAFDRQIAGAPQRSRQSALPSNSVRVVN